MGKQHKISVVETVLGCVKGGLGLALAASDKPSTDEGLDQWGNSNRYTAEETNLAVVQVEKANPQFSSPGVVWQR